MVHLHLKKSLQVQLLCQDRVLPLFLQVFPDFFLRLCLLCLQQPLFLSFFHLRLFPICPVSAALRKSSYQKNLIKHNYSPSFSAAPETSFFSSSFFGGFILKFKNLITSSSSLRLYSSFCGSSGFSVLKFRMKPSLLLSLWASKQKPARNDASYTSFWLIYNQPPVIYAGSKDFSYYFLIAKIHRFINTIF